MRNLPCKNHLTTLLIALLTTPIFSNPSDIQALIESGTLQVNITSKGGHTGECLRLRAANVGSEFIVTKLSPGQILYATDADQQDIIVVNELVIALSPGQSVERNVFGFCCQSQDASPSSSQRFKIGPLADKYLQEMAEYINAHRHIPEEVQQAALWVLSDCHPISSIRKVDAASQDLIAFTAALLGLPKPWYSTDHAATVNQLFNPNVERIYGQMPFEVLANTRITVVILNEEGKVVKRLLNGSIYGPGNYSFPLDLYVSNWEKGNYQVRFIDEREQEFNRYTFEI